MPEGATLLIAVLTPGGGSGGSSSSSRGNPSDVDEFNSGMPDVTTPDTLS